VRKLCILLGSIVLLSSCGGGIEGVASSVQVTASFENADVQVDLRKWVDSDGDNVCDTYSIGTANTQLTVRVTPLPDLPNNITPSPVKIDKIKLVFIPMTRNSPSLSAQERYVSITVNPGNTVTKSVEVFDAHMGDYLNNLYTGEAFKYSVQAYLHYIEIYSGKEGSIKLGLNLEVADFVTQDEKCVPP